MYAVQCFEKSFTYFSFVHVGKLCRLRDCGGKDQQGLFNSSGIFRDVYINILCKLCWLCDCGTAVAGFHEIFQLWGILKFSRPFSLPSVIFFLHNDCVYWHAYEVFVLGTIRFMETGQGIRTWKQVKALLHIAAVSALHNKNMKRKQHCD